MDMIKKNSTLRTAAYVVAGLGLAAFLFWFLLVTPLGSFFGDKW